MAAREVIPVLVEALKEQKKQADAVQEADAARISAREQRLPDAKRL